MLSRKGYGGWCTCTVQKRVCGADMEVILFDDVKAQQRAP